MHIASSATGRCIREGDVVARILLVDDEMAILVVLETILKFAGHETVSCNDSSKVEGILNDSRFDLMISDIKMTPVDGIQLLKIANAMVPPVPTLLVSACEYLADGKTPESIGAAGHLRKPFSNKELLRITEEATKKASIVH
ncbi:MAG: response regulator [bacterium]